jgi:hypothetical protein
MGQLLAESVPRAMSKTSAPDDHLASTAHAKHDKEDNMKYLCTVWVDEATLETMTRSEHEALNAEALAYDEELRRGGHFLAANALQPAHTATSLRVRDGKISTTDGPFVETKEQLGGFILIEARDLNEAIHLASKIPPARLGGIEVRPVKELKSPS